MTREVGGSGRSDLGRAHSGVGPALREQLTRLIQQLAAAADGLHRLRQKLGQPSPPEEDEILEGLRPPTLAFHLTGLIDCVLEESLASALSGLREGAELTQDALNRDWRQCQAKRGMGDD